VREPCVAALVLAAAAAGWQRASEQALQRCCQALLASRTVRVPALRALSPREQASRRRGTSAGTSFIDLRVTLDYWFIDERSVGLGL
jgi:hypothetical protein